ncbi:MAG TPA: hypothetical protein VL332_12265 [Candidatus Saccharimonadaceae bacterium]|jgi:hypothetical protein|nr:hypothetical protein [Candidatus Saccharimonadaceae bacterium]
MNRLRLLIPSVALAALTATGCFLVTGQFIVSVALGNLSAVNGLSSAGKYIDLAAESSDYKDHKSKLKDIPDIAVLGTIKNNLPAPVSGEVWLVPNPSGSTLLADKTAVQAAGGIKVWSLALAANETRNIDWDTSAGLFTSAGKAALTSDIKGDGIFALYVFGSTATYDLTITNGQIVVVISAGP